MHASSWAGSQSPVRGWGTSVLKPILELLLDSPVLGTLASEHLRSLAQRARIMSFEAGESIMRQGAPADACFVLLAGKVAMSFRPADGNTMPDSGHARQDLLHLRDYDDTGRLLGWSALLEPYRYRATIVALEPTQVLVLERHVLEKHMAAHPEFAVALMERIIWVLGNRLRETRIRLVARRYEKEVTAIRALLDQSAELLRVDSPLHKIPYYLENRLTVADAFKALELVMAHGDAHERDLAANALEILQQVRKELALYQDLQHVYEAVASAPADVPAREIRKQCCREFIKLFERLDFVIQGEENLPDTPGHIFIMNHLFNHPDNTLPNRFQLTLDTHFVSSMILLRKYGEAPVRVIRKSLSDEFGHQKYYDRLGYIYVSSGHVDETEADMRTTPSDRRRHFLNNARNHLRAARNIVICPEGTSVSTEESPVGFKAGAFRLAAYVEPEPLIVPISVANFDKNITRKRLAAIVHEPFRLSEAVPNADDDVNLFDFINRYQHRFAEYVRQTKALADAAEISP